MIRKSAQNNIELIYINSDFPFVASAYIVERTPVQILIDTMKSTRVLSKEQVLKKCKFFFFYFVIQGRYLLCI